MPAPLVVTDAISRAENWWQAAEVVRVFPDGNAASDFFAWFRQHQLGRKRLLDTLLAASFRQAKVTKIITNNAKDYEVLGAFEVVGFRRALGRTEGGGALYTERGRSPAQVRKVTRFPESENKTG